MFTGLIEEVGTIVSNISKSFGFEINIEAGVVMDDLTLGDSIAINGVCMTVTKLEKNHFTVQAVEETLKRTSLRTLNRGALVNLERALKINSRLGGHIVQGHVDGTGVVVGKRSISESVLFTVTPEQHLLKYIVEKGSIAVEGISLTVSSVSGNQFGVSVIPHTLKHTTLANTLIGNLLNIETDVLAKYCEKLLIGDKSLTLDTLKESGYA